MPFDWRSGTSDDETCMFVVRFEKRWFTFTVLSVLSGLCIRPVLAEGSLSAREIIQQAAARGQAARDPSKTAYTYTKVTVTDHLGSGGKVSKHEQKVWQVSLRQGSMSAKLLEVNGQAPRPVDLRKQNENETSLRQILGDSNSTPENRDNFLTPEVVARYEFSLAGETNVAGRRAYIVNFRPATPEPPVRHLVDRLLNRISGTLWIDAQEFEIARAEIQLRSEVDLLGGLAGCLRKLAYNMTRVRVADGVWIKNLASGDFEGRKFLESMHIRTSSQVRDFRTLAAG